MPFSSSSSSSTEQSTPFSLSEFGNLVALALNGDRLSEIFLGLDPEQSSNSFHVLTPPHKPHHPPSPPSSYSMLSPSPPHILRGRTTSTGASAVSSRPRLILEKLKRQASALVLRPSAPREDTQKPPIVTVSPYIHITHSESSVDDHEDDDDDLSLPHEHDEFTPYLPLVAQYERAALLAKSASNTSLKIPTADNSNTLSCNKSLPTGRNTIFSRPASALTDSTAATPLRISPPPSPSSSHSSSTASTATDPLTPKTPTFNALGYTSSSCSFSTSSSASRSRWSLCTDDSIPIPTPPPYPLFCDHPFARSNIVSDADPFAKGSVQVVRQSSSEYYNSSVSPSAKQDKSKRNTRTLYPAPTRPPPVGPLPHLPSISLSTDEEVDSRVRETEEWTLKLGLPPSLIPTPTTGDLDVHLKPPSPQHPRHHSYLQPPSTTTTSSSSSSHPQTRIRTRSLSPLPPTKYTQHVHTHPIKPKPKILRIQIEPENALDADKDDWTLSLPLLPPSHSYSAPGPEPNSAPSSALKFSLPGDVEGDREERKREEGRGRVRPRHKSQPGPGKEKEKQKEKERGKERRVRERVSVQSLPYRQIDSSHLRATTRASASFVNLKSVAGTLAMASRSPGPHRVSAPVPAHTTAPAPALVSLHNSSRTSLHFNPNSKRRTQTDTQSQPKPQSDPTKIKLPDPPRTADSVSSASTIVPRRVLQEQVRQMPIRIQTEEQEREERELMQYALSSASVRTSRSSSQYSSSSFADSGVGILDIALGMDVDRDRAVDEELRWIDGVRLPSTPNVNLDPEMMMMSQRRARREIKAEKEKEIDRMSMVSDHSMYYSARSSLLGGSVRSSLDF